jgi:HEAT repeat protein
MYSRDRAPLLTLLLIVATQQAWVASAQAVRPLTMPAAVAAAEKAPKSSVRDLLTLQEVGDAVIASLVYQVDTASPEDARTLEADFIALLEAPGASFSARQFSCRMLARIGTARSVPALAGLLADPELSHAARLALEAIPGKQSLAALQKALKTTTANTRLGVIDSLGARGDSASISPLAALAKGKDEATALGAMKALARIGGPKVARTLMEMKVAASRQAALDHARLVCAASLPDDEALRVYRSLSDPRQEPQIRIAAFLGMIRCEPERAPVRLAAALKSDDPVLVSAAEAAIFDWGDSAGIEALAKELPALPAGGKVALLRGLSGRASVPVRPELLNPLLDDADPEVRLTAIRVADLLGDATSVAPLVAVLSGGDEPAKSALRALGNLQGAGVLDEMIRLAASSGSKVRVDLVTILTERQATAAVPVLYQFLGDPDAKVRQAAIKALGRLASTEDVPKLTDLLLTTGFREDRQALALAVTAVARRDESIEERCTPLLGALEQADAEVKPLLLGALGSLGGTGAYAALKSHLDGPVPELRKSALRALGDWPDAGPMSDLVEVAREDADPTNRILALRGYIRCIGLGKTMPAAERCAHYREAMGLAVRPEEKWLVLTGLADVSSLEALRLVEGALDDPALKNEAMPAYAKIATSLAKGHPIEARAALQRVVAEGSDATVVRRAQRTLETIQ